ncbi:HTH-type transcriptional regulator MalT [compost metagenome]
MLERSRGWCAGSCLLLLGLATGQQPRADSSQAWLMDYLRCEVLDQLPGDWQLALFSLAQFPHFDRELCEQLLGAGEGAQMLSQLRECGLFIEPVDQHGRLFRVQPLLAPLLAGQLPDTVVRTLFRKACQWYASREQIRPALACAIKAGQPEMAASLMRCYRDDHLLQGRGPALLLEWCRELPTALRSGSPRLVLLNAWALLISGRLDEGQRYIAALGRFLPQADASRQRELIAQWKALAGKLAFHLGDAERARPLLAEAIAELPERAWCQRLLCYLLQVELALIDGDFDKARHLNRVALRQARGRASQAMESLLVLEHAKLLEVRGELLRAETQLIRLYGELTSAWSAEPSPMRGRTLLQHAGLLLKRGRYEDAETAFVSGLRECLACSDPAAIWGHLGLAELSALQGDVAGAFARIADAERLMQYNQISAHLYQGLSLLARVRLWLGQGSHVQAERALRRLLLEAVPLPPFGAPELNMRLHLALAQAQLAGDQVETALDSLLTLHAKAIGEGRLPLACEAGFSLAEGLYASNRPAQARESLLEARTLARRMGLVSVEQAFASRNPAMMRWACESGGADVAPAALLSRRELDVLRLIVQGCSNRQIAERLLISLYTVKSHAHRINFKLGVERRTQAVARAKDMGLFG